MSSTTETQGQDKVKMLEILVKKIRPDALIPTKEKRDIPDAGWDLYTNEDVRVPGGGKKLARTGIAMAIPKGWAGHIRPRSGIAANTPIMLDAGVIDGGYRDEIKIVLVNTSDFPFLVDKNTKIAQIVFEKVPEVIITEVEELPSSERGTKGFGSSDKK